jgi:hypothetical protein
MNQNITTIPNTKMYVKKNASKEDLKLDNIIQMPENRLLIAKKVPRGSIIMPGSDGSYQLNFANEESSQTKNKITPEKTFFGKQGKLIVLDGKRYKANKVKGLDNIVNIGLYDPGQLVKGIKAASVAIPIVLGGIGCKTTGPDPTPPSNIYYITADAREISEHFPNLADAVITIGNQKVSPGETVTYEGKMIELNTTGGHNNVMCLRGGYSNNSNISQSQNNESIIINLETLGSEARKGDQVKIILYKIPARLPIADIKEALIKGTAVYDHAVTFYPVNDGYSTAEFEKMKKGLVADKANNALNQITTIPGVPGCNYDPNKTSGSQRIRLSPDYRNPGHAESGSGIMTASEILITHDGLIEDYLEELYQAMGVRHDIGDGSIKDDISNTTGTLNQFGRDLMTINYFLNPGTKLGL